MRKRVENNGLTVNAITGNHAVFLGFDLTDAARAGCLGFAVQREDLTSHTVTWLSGFKTFKSQVPAPALTTIYSTQHQPIQAMWWGDYTTTPGHQYRYTVLPQYGTPDSLAGKDSVTAQVEVTTNDPDTGTHGIYFNRGVAASQAYATKFGDPPDQLPPAKRAAAMRWLSRGLHEALIAYITEGAGPALALRAAVYQFTEPSVLAAFAQAQAAGADVRIIYHADGDEGQANSDAIQAAVDAAGFDRASVIPRRHATIAHNKFIVRAERAADGTLSPAQVWTGSTNLSQGGIFGHSNVGHAVRDVSVAQAYLDFWGRLADDPVRHLMRDWTDEHSPFDADALGEAGIHPLFSPRSALDPLDWYATNFATSPASTSITLPFGLDDDHFEAQLAAAHTPGVLRFVLLDSRDNDQDVWSADRMVQVAVGATGNPGVLSTWAAEQLSGFNQHARYLHTKILLVDPLGELPVTVSGSANFSKASTDSNDENMLVITGDTEVADVYFSEFQRIFDHFYARWWAQRLHHQAPEAHDYLTEDDSWLEPYYKAGTPKFARRILYAGTG